MMDYGPNETMFLQWIFCYLIFELNVNGKWSECNTANILYHSSNIKLLNNASLCLLCWRILHDCSLLYLHTTILWSGMLNWYRSLSFGAFDMSPSLLGHRGVHPRICVRIALLSIYPAATGYFLDEKNVWMSRT